VVNNRYAPDGYRYGVMFDDGSVAHRWNGATQRERAESYLAQMLELFPGDNITLARARPDGTWKRV
jgi:hypothetical protein